jgi:hypothetical protein
MSAWFRDDPATLLEDALKIAFNFLSRSGEIDDPMEATGFLADNIHFMIGQGQHNQVALANRAIAAYQRDQKARANERAIMFDRTS